MEGDGWVLRSLSLTLLWLLLVVVGGGLWTVSTVRSNCNGTAVAECAHSVRLSTGPAAFGILLVGLGGAAVIAAAAWINSARR